MKKMSVLYLLPFRGTPLHYTAGLIVLVGLLLMNVNGLAQTTKTYSSSGTFTPPAGITTVTAECWGGGGKGGTRTTNGPAAGGGGGAYSKGAATVVAGTAYTVTVGTGSTTVAAGLDSWFVNTTTVLAKGGNSVADNDNTSGLGGASTSGIGNLLMFSGGNGALGTTGVRGGGGGSSGGTAADGIYINPVPSNSAGGTITGGGSGGNGRSTTQGNGSNGFSPGGGGGGALRTSTLTRTGGNGANGQVSITYSCVTYSLTSVTPSDACAGGTSTVTLANTTASSLPVGTYTVTYSLSGGNTASNQTAAMIVTTEGTGDFTTIALVNGVSTTITINSLASGSDGVADLCTSPVSNTGTITVNSSPAPTFTAVPGVVTLVNTDVTYTTEAGKTNYIWGVPGTAGTDYSITSGGIDNASNTVTLKWLTSGNKTVTVNYSNGTCSAATPASNTTAIDIGNRYSVATGNWNATTTWAISSGGTAGASVPLAENNVFIEGGNNVTVDADAACTSLSFTTTTATSLSISPGILLEVSGGITIPRSDAGVNLIAVGEGILNAGSIAFTNGDGAVRHEITISNGVVNVFGDITTDNTGASASITFTGAGTLNAGAGIMTTTTSGGTLTTFAGCTVAYNGDGDQVVKNVSYFGNLILSGSGTKTWTRSGNRVIGGDLIVDMGTVLTTTGNFTILVNGATLLSGTLNLGGTSAKSFTGDVIVDNGGIWNETEVAAINYAGNLENNGNYTTAAGTHTFSGVAKTIGGVNAIAIPNLTITGTTTNIGTLTVSTMLAGTGTLTNGATGILNFGGTAITPTLQATAPGNIVNYTGTSQTVKATTYDNLALSGGSAKAMTASTIINDNFSIALGTKADFGTITTHTAKTLTLDGAGTLNGKWGSSGATAANFNNDDYFVAASTGYITISTLSCTAPEITSGPLPVTFCENGGGSFTVIAPGAGLTYQWKYFDINTFQWLNTDGIPGFTGHTSATLTLSNTPIAYNGTEFRCVVTSGGCSTTSGNASPTINPLPASAGSISGPFDVLQGATAVAYSVAPITEAASYVWAYSGTGVTINGTGNSVTLDFSLLATSGDLTVKGQNSCGDGVSSVIPVTVGTLWAPTAFNVTGSGPYCSGGTGLAVGISDSENGVTYTLYKDGVAQPAPVAGTGNAITFGPQLEGVFTVKGSNGITTDMTGSAVITVVDPPTAYAGPTSTAVVDVPFLLSGSTATNYTSIVWTLGTNATGVFSDPAILHPTYTQSGPAGVSVTLILTVSNGGICPNAESQVQLVMISTGDSKTWSGGSSNSWEASGNWTPTDGFIPKPTTNVTIPAGTPYSPIINSAVVCNDLTIAPGAVLTIAEGKSLSVGGTFLNNASSGGLIIKSGGSLIQNSVVNATVERNINAWSTYGGWHLLSSPVTSQVIDPAFTDATPANYDFYAWSEPLNTWMNQKVGANNIVSFTPGTGYLVAYATGSTKQFTGTLNIANIPLSGLTKSAEANSGWHLLGNPFPSAIAWGTANWSLSNILATAKVWKETTASYVDIAPSDAIPAMNGFMVETSGGGSLTIPAAARIHNSTPWYKSSEGKEMIKLVAHDLDYNTAQESIIKVNDNATESFDSNFDSHFLAGYAPTFYSTAGDEHLSTNAIPEISDSRIIPMVFVKNSAKNFRIELVENNINGVSALFLTDKKTGIVTDLNTTQVYNFTAADGDDANRFELSFLAVTKVSEPSAKDNFTVYQSNGIISITSPTNADAEILVTNLVGQVVMRGKTNGNSFTTLNTNNLKNGVYVISLVGSNGKVVSKKMVLSK